MTRAVNDRLSRHKAETIAFYRRFSERKEESHEARGDARLRRRARRLIRIMVVSIATSTHKRIAKGRFHGPAFSSKSYIRPQAPDSARAALPR